MVQSIISINHGAKGNFSKKKKALLIFFSPIMFLLFFFLKIGIIAWDDPTPDDIKSSASLLALALPSMSAEFILNPSVEVRRVMVDGVDFGVWMTTAAVVERERERERGDNEGGDNEGGDNEGGGMSMRMRVLVLGANMNESGVMIELERLGVRVGEGGGGRVEQVLDSGATLVEDEGEDKKKTKTRLMFTPLGSGGWIFDF